MSEVVGDFALHPKAQRSGLDLSSHQTRGPSASSVHMEYEGKKERKILEEGLNTLQEL